MIQGKATVSPQDDKEDVAVVPLAIPITVGPGTIGALLVMGAGLETIPGKLPPLWLSSAPSSRSADSSSLPDASNACSVSRG